MSSSYSLAFNWDEGLIDDCARLNKTGRGIQVGEFFGSLRFSPVGSGRPGMYLAGVDFEQAARQVALMHARGIRFAYIANAPCLGNREFKNDYAARLLAFFDQIVNGLGADTVVLTVPYLIEMVKRNFPRVGVKASVIAHINSIPLLMHFQELGVDMIVLDYMQNRNFPFLREAVKAARVPLELHTNDCCLYGCPYRQYHYNINGHADQEDYLSRANSIQVDYCLLKCGLYFYRHPEELIKSRWIRPEDVEVYERIGINHFKGGNRQWERERLRRLAGAYLARRWDGNLLELLAVARTEVGETNAKKPPGMSGREWEQALDFRAGLRPGVPVELDNRALDGFLEHFFTQDCQLACGRCRYCASVAERAVRINEPDALEQWLSLQESRAAELAAGAGQAQGGTGKCILR
ncbi:hypothetical protein [Desulfotomaculum copahuensis]|uniref:Peptidase U32 n=1 Tax=Desulfotomaculum copahuensis TaxID=1838280 RepID=A0A1B7LFX5_9FIRM|nr:hypothetical protein [Desulfotomaculum copahuensis]OAT83600.1 hypothetical protein A6M21_07905 [Desulfotomaculum copahuensis]